VSENGWGFIVFGIAALFVLVIAGFLWGWIP
jgi:hypothetical protein